MKVILATGLEAIDSYLRELEDIEILDSCADLEVIKDLISYSNPNGVIMNRYLDETEEGEKIRQVVKAIRAKDKEVRFIILIGQYEEKFISSMVNLGIYDLLVGEEITTEAVLDILHHPKHEFDFEKHLKVKETRAKPQGKVKC